MCTCFLLSSREKKPGGLFLKIVGLIFPLIISKANNQAKSNLKSLIFSSFLKIRTLAIEEIAPLLHTADHPSLSAKRLSPDSSTESQGNCSMNEKTSVVDVARLSCMRKGLTPKHGFKYQQPTRRKSKSDCFSF